MTIEELLVKDISDATKDRSLDLERRNIAVETYRTYLQAQYVKPDIERALILKAKEAKEAS